MTGASHPLDADLLDAVAQFAALAAPGHPLLVASDFDGVLSPLVDDPSASRMTPTAAAALTRLAEVPDDRLRLALVSGRTLDSLGALALAPPGTVLVGSHGAERGEMLPTAPGIARTPFELSAREADLLARVTSGLAEIASGVEGAWVEHKPSAAVLHTRLAAPADGERAAEAGHSLGTELGAHTMRGQDVVEIAVVAASKGQALTVLRLELAAAAVFYMGDDVTDERAFEVLGPGDLTVKVGPAATAARFRVATTDDAVAVLVALADALSTEASQGGHD
ncbi:trehalose 6-phosphatase [Sanguibacter gelidistatuariae]|uniref:Trehalose 6-phosphate phosphatase n=1 Tax=Sanguibacter gelidistatuariae TaxID=1814289 RepID=A0A1G6PSD5_9MICO|nr:trehalose-phosphatase [Sanguibacter gelidistatuariae]SDC82297.1 trehalose 6-phosphatase [Sanguibacter gelidistatuariae]